jgi:hypothetical protein
VGKSRTALVGSVVSLVMMAGLGCGGGGGTVVVPATPPTVQDNFFVTWEIQSGTVGPLTCEEVGATTVDMDIVNVDTGARFVDSFDCRAYQGTSGPVDVGRFDVLVNLTDPSGGVISQTDIGTENVSMAGTIDLGHVIFTVP